LLASAKAFSAFFALASADLCDFSAFALAAVATSKALREALSSVSSDQCKHWLMLKHLQSSKERKGEVKQKAKRSTQDKQR
jgi:hypothetical protein